MKFKNVFLVTCLCFASLSLSAQPDLPLFDISQANYKGAFRIPADIYGASNINYSEGPIAYNTANHSLYIVGHTVEQAIVEFSIPELSTGEISDLISSDAIFAKGYLYWNSDIGLSAYARFEIAKNADFNFSIKKCDYESSFAALQMCEWS